MKCIYNFENEIDPKLVSVDQCMFNNIHSNDNGGCILENRSVILSIIKTIFCNCSSLGNGGAFYLSNNEALAIIQKTCFIRIIPNSFGGVYYAKCVAVNSFLNLCYQNGNVNFSQIVLIEKSNQYNEKQTNFSNNIAGLCPCFYALDGTNANIKFFTEINSHAKSGALIDTNFMSGKVTFEKVNCIGNSCEEDSYGIFYFDGNNIEFKNVNVFYNIGYKKFGTFLNCDINSYNCYTDFSYPEISFSIAPYCFNDFEALDQCFLSLSNKICLNTAPFIGLYFISALFFSSKIVTL